jgi:hypothetical protein
MTEAEWLTCTDPSVMLEHLKGKTIDRRMRLFAVACCRSMWHRIIDQQWRKVVECAEQVADGRASLDEMEAARRAASAGRTTETTLVASQVRHDGWTAAWHTARQAVMAASWAASLDLRGERHGVRKAASRAARGEQEQGQIALLRDLLGNPFRPVACDSACRTAVVISLATAAYEERNLPSGHLDNERLAVLADALEEAGADADLVAHCCQPGPHVRGCWAVDLILGKG